MDVKNMAGGNVARVVATPVHHLAFTGLDHHDFDGAIFKNELAALGERTEKDGLAAGQPLRPSVRLFAGLLVKFGERAWVSAGRRDQR